MAMQYGRGSGVHKSRLQELGQILNDVFMNPEFETRNGKVLKNINRELHEMAMKESGCSRWELEDEMMQSHTVVRHYYTTLSFLTAKVYMEAAQQLYHVKGWQ